MAKLEIKVIKVQQLHEHGSFRCYLQIGGIERILPRGDWEANELIKALSLDHEKTEKSTRVIHKPYMKKGMEAKVKHYFDVYYS